MPDIAQMLAQEVYEPKQEQLLQSEEIKRRLREKAELLAELEDRNPRPSPSSSNLREKAELLAELDFRNPKPEPVPVVVPALTGRITADGRKLAGLASRARKLDAIAHVLAGKLDLAQIAAEGARIELQAYMRETGLA